MKTIELDVSLAYKDLVEIFFKANGLFELGFTLTVVDAKYTIPINVVMNRHGSPERQYESTQTRKAMVCSYDENNEEQANKILFMSLQHLGFNNMLHDFLNKCGITSKHYRLQ